MKLHRHILSLLFLALPPACMAASMSADEVESSYVFNFVKFAVWPDSALGKNDDLNLCVVGNESLGELLARMDGHKVRQHAVQVMQNKQYGDDLHGCQVVFVGESERHKAAAIIKEIGDAPVLTISSIDGFAEKGGCIGLVYRDNRMLFEVNLDALRRKQLQMPAQVLNLATNVFGR